MTEISRLSLHFYGFEVQNHYQQGFRKIFIMEKASVYIDDLKIIQSLNHQIKECLKFFFAKF